MDFKITMLTISAIYWLHKRVVSIPENNLTTTDGILDKKNTFESNDFAADSKSSVSESGLNDILNKSRDSSTRLLADGTTNPSPHVTTPGISESNSISARRLSEVNITELRTILKCVDYSLCLYNENKQMPICFCDSLCLMYDDCCIDYHKENKITHETSLEKTGNSTQLSHENDDRYREIQTFQSFLSCSVWCYGRQYIGYQFVSPCPDDTNADLDDLCVHNDFNIPLTMIPVVGANGMHFRNTFCAKCHNMSVIKFWNLIINDDVGQISISLSELTKEMLLHVFAQSHCISVVIPPDNEDIRHCIKTIDRPQEDVANTLLHYNNKPYTSREVCGMYRAPVYISVHQHNNNNAITAFNAVTFIYEFSMRGTQCNSKA